MSTDAEKNHLTDLLDAAKGACEYVGLSSKEEFRLNQRDRDSVNYKFIMIGEAVDRLGKDFHAKHPSIPWIEMIAMRNIVAHRYGRVDPDIVWDVVKTRLPPVIVYLNALIRGPGHDDPGDLGGGEAGGGRLGRDLSITRFRQGER